MGLGPLRKSLECGLASRHLLVALICVLASPLLSLVMQGSGIALVKLRSPVRTAPPAAPVPIARLSESDRIETPAEPQLAASRVRLEAESLGQGVQPQTTPAPSLPDMLRGFAAATLATGCWESRCS